MNTTTGIISADGDAGARRATQLLACAACAEASPSSLQEDYAKVDLKLSFRNRFEDSKLLTFHVQVKSGESYRAAHDDEDEIKLRIDALTLHALSGTGLPGIIAWVPAAPATNVYWYACDPRRGLKLPPVINANQYVRPSISYDLTRLCVYSSWSQGFKQQTARESSEESIQSIAKSAYRELKRSEWRHPLVGNLLVTRSAWRHVTRRSKTKKRRLMSLRVTPYLKAFLSEMPDRYTYDIENIRAHEATTTETRYLLCWYRKALSISGDTYSVLLRIREDISYPTAWKDMPLSIKDISQKATLASWWCKPTTK